MNSKEFENKVKELIDDLKSVSNDYGLGNTGDEFKIITQIFLYKFLNDKFAHEIKQLEPALSNDDNWQETLSSYKKDDYEMLLMQLSEGTALLHPHHFISYLFHKQDEPNFANLFDETFSNIAILNNDIFSVKEDDGSKIKLFDRLSEFVSVSKRDPFCKAIINKLVNFSFEPIFNEKYDFYATIFEYLISDYNKDSGDVYAEYFTPYAVAKIISACLVTENVSNVSCYDPSAGSGTLLMSLAHTIGEDKCSIYSQDISQKSSSFLRLNLILNNLVHSIQNIIQGNTIEYPSHKQENGELEKFDYIVSNPPFKLDFSDYSEDLDTKANNDRFFAGIPKVPNKNKKSMAIYLLFIQHIMHSLTAKGKAAIVVPTGFITAQSGIEKKIRQKMVDNKILAGVISMPSNIFATTGTSVSILFLDNSNKEDVVLIDASKLGTKVKEGKNQKTVLSETEEQQIIDVFNSKEAKGDFSVVVSYDDIKTKNYSLSAGQYFEVKIEYIEITNEEFKTKMRGFENNLDDLFQESKTLEKGIKEHLKSLKYD
jgi:type I restriction enzyme M protein